MCNIFTSVNKPLTNFFLFKKKLTEFLRPFGTMKQFFWLILKRQTQPLIIHIIQHKLQESIRGKCRGKIISLQKLQFYIANFNKQMAFLMVRIKLPEIIICLVIWRKIFVGDVFVTSLSNKKLFWPNLRITGDYIE